MKGLKELNVAGQATRVPGYGRNIFFALFLPYPSIAVFLINESQEYH